MKLVYTGKEAEFPPKQTKKLEARLHRIGKLMGRGEKEARVTVTRERFLHRAQLTVNLWDHRVVAEGADADLYTAVTGAVDHLEKQLTKMRTKWRDTARHKDAPQAVEPPAPAPAKNGARQAKAAKSAAPTRRKPKVFRAGQSDTPDHRVKPMTVEEALLEIDAAEDYFVFEEAGTGKRNVLLRRKDGHFDLIEG